MNSILRGKLIKKRERSILIYSMCLILIAAGIIGLSVYKLSLNGKKNVSAGRLKEKLNLIKI